MESRLEHFHRQRVQKVLQHRDKSMAGYQPHVVLWAEHHELLVRMGAASVGSRGCWFGLMNTNGWELFGKQDTANTWRRIMKNEGMCAWINFQGPGIAWEYPEQAAVTEQYGRWIEEHGLHVNHGFGVASA